MKIITNKLTILLFCSVLVIYPIVCITDQMYNLNLVEKKYTNIQLSISDTCSQSIAFVVIES